MLPGLERILIPLLLLASGTALQASGPASVTIVPSPHSSLLSCEAHVVDAEGTELIAPCGESIPLSHTPARAWLESYDAITPFLTEVPAPGVVMIDTLVPAASVSFPPNHVLRDGERIRLVSLTPPRDARSLRPMFVRDVTALTARPRVPAGNILALLLDAKGRVVAASRPVRVRTNEKNAIWPDVRPESATVVAHLARPRPIQTADADKLSIRLEGVAPEVVVNASDAFFCVWYGLEGRRAHVSVDSDALRIARDAIDLARGNVTSIDDPLRLLPSLTVSVDPLPEAITLTNPLTLTIARAADEETPIRTIAIEPGRRKRIDLLPAELLAVDLDIDGFRMRERVDLAEGEDASLTIPLEPISVSGTVYLGNVPARAAVRIRQKGDPITIETDDRGAYAVTLWQPQRYFVETTIAGRSAAYIELMNIAASGLIDIHVPANVLRARLFDAVDGKPLTHGEITIHSRWRSDAGMQSSGTTIAVQGELTELPPLRGSTAEIHVRATGYADAAPLAVTIDDIAGERVLEFPMRRAASATELLVLLDGTAPAAGAELATWSDGNLLWRATADDAGRVPIPENIVTKRVIVRHPGAASEVMILGALGASPRLSLHPAAPPLVAEVVRRDGKHAGPAAAKICLVGGVRLCGPEAAFYTWSLAATSPDGKFLARGLPRRPLRILATRRATNEQIATGTFDSLATAIPFPWPPLATVTIVDE